jgi:Uma2 family endonuclease
MASATLIPVSEYLETVYSPDCDYIDGERLERNVGEREHSALQAIIVSIFQANRRAWNVFGLPELRNQVSTSNYRVPDVCIVRATDPRDRIVRKAPLICIEILSSGDTFLQLREKVDNYIGMGVEHIWTLDPWNRRGYLCTATAFIQPESGELVVPETPIKLVLAEIFAELDEML